MKTLYLADMDGTLMTPEKTISPQTAGVLNALMEEGLLFTVATARSVGTLGRLLAPLRLTLPVSMMNGVLIGDPGAGSFVHVEEIPIPAALEIAGLMEEFSLGSYLFTLEDGVLYANYRQIKSAYQRQFLAARAGSRKVFRQVDSIGEAAARHPVFFSFTGEDERRMEEIFLRLQRVRGVRPVIYRDHDDGVWFVETASERAGKAAALGWLKQYTGAGRVVAFGDNANDLDMLAAADVACAVGNAIEEVRRAADVVVPSNREDGVARFIAEDFLGR